MLQELLDWAQLITPAALLAIGGLLWKISRHMARLDFRVELMWLVFVREHRLDGRGDDRLS